MELMVLTHGTSLAASSLAWSNLVADGVHVWMVRLHDSADHQEALSGLLSVDERARAARYRFPNDQRRFVTTRGALRLVLGAYGNCDPQAIVFDYVCVCGNTQCAISRRKPVLRPGLLPDELRFNVSHSDDVALIAVGTEREIGVDIERIRLEIEWRALAREALSPSDAAEVLTRSGRDGLMAFYRCWTHKEAFLKALGRGLTTPRAQQPQDLAATALEHRFEHTWRYEHRIFSARALEGVPAGSVAALVLEANPSSTQIPVRPLPLAGLVSTHCSAGPRQTHSVT